MPVLGIAVVVIGWVGVGGRGEEGGHGVDAQTEEVVHLLEHVAVGGGQEDAAVRVVGVVRRGGFGEEVGGGEGAHYAECSNFIFRELFVFSLNDGGVVVMFWFFLYFFSLSLFLVLLKWWLFVVRTHQEASHQHSFLVPYSPLNTLIGSFRKCSYFVNSHLSIKKQEALIEKAGHQMPMVIRFDLHRSLEAAPDALPVTGKVYFPPCFAAAEQGVSRWDAVPGAIRQLPRINKFPNIIRSLETIEVYLAGKPKKYQDGFRYLATDFLAPEKTRLEICMRYPKRDFDGVWEFYTLGGRIKGLEEDKEKYRDLMNFMSDDNNAAEGTTQVPASTANGSALGKPRVKTTTIYFSLSADNPGPAPKIGFLPANSASNDQIIAKGLDQWLSKYGWYDGGKTLEERLDNSL